MSAAEFDEWQAFYSLEPFGPLIADQRAARAAHLQAVAHLSPGDGKPFAAAQFALADWGDAASTDEDDDLDLFDQFERAFGKPTIFDNEDD